MVEVYADKCIVIVSELKLCGDVGPGVPVSVEIDPFCHELTISIAAVISFLG